MRNLPSTFGLLIVLIAFVFFQGTPAPKAAPANRSHINMFGQDTLPPKVRDTSMYKHGKKEWKKKDKNKEKGDTTSKKYPR